MKIDGKIKESLLTVIGQVDGNQAEAARKLNIHPSSLGRYITGEAKTITDDCWDRLLRNASFMATYRELLAQEDEDFEEWNSALDKFYAYLNSVLDAKGVTTAQVAAAWGTTEDVARRKLGGNSNLDDDRIAALSNKGILCGDELLMVQELQSEVKRLMDESDIRDMLPGGRLPSAEERYSGTHGRAEVIDISKSPMPPPAPTDHERELAQLRFELEKKEMELRAVKKELESEKRAMAFERENFQLRAQLAAQGKPVAVESGYQVEERRDPDPLTDGGCDKGVMVGGGKRG